MTSKIFRQTVTDLLPFIITKLLTLCGILEGKAMVSSAQTRKKNPEKNDADKPETQYSGLGVMIGQKCCITPPSTSTEN
jgi:hypothetical protein